MSSSASSDLKAFTSDRPSTKSSRDSSRSFSVSLHTTRLPFRLQVLNARARLDRYGYQRTAAKIAHCCHICCWMPEDAIDEDGDVALYSEKCIDCLSVTLALFRSAVCCAATAGGYLYCECREPQPQLTLAHTFSTLELVLHKKSKQATYQWQRRKARIAQCFYLCCCDSHGLASRELNACTVIKVKSVSCLSSFSSLCVTALCAVATCGVSLCFCEFREPEEQKFPNAVYRRSYGQHRRVFPTMEPPSLQTMEAERGKKRVQPIPLERVYEEAKRIPSAGSLLDVESGLSGSQNGERGSNYSHSASAVSDGE